MRPPLPKSGRAHLFASRKARSSASDRRCGQRTPDLPDMFVGHFYKTAPLGPRTHSAFLTFIQGSTCPEIRICRPHPVCYGWHSSVGCDETWALFGPKRGNRTRRVQAECGDDGRGRRNNWITCNSWPPRQVRLDASRAPKAIGILQCNHDHGSMRASCAPGLVPRKVLACRCGTACRTQCRLTRISRP